MHKMLTAWRLSKLKFLATAFDGEGSARFGGRWNSKRVRVVYCSGTLSLAVLETLVHLNPPIQFQYGAFRVEIPEECVEYVSMASLPEAWRATPAGALTRGVGDQWIRGRKSAVLAVPSVLVPQEFNLLLNPEHPDFQRLRINAPVPYSLDPRLLPAGL